MEKKSSFGDGPVFCDGFGHGGSPSSGYDSNSSGYSHSLGFEGA